MTAVGTPSVIKDLARTTLANLTAFRAWHQDTPLTVDQALARVFLDALPLPPNNQAEYTPADLAAIRPYAVVSIDQSGGLTWTADAGPTHIKPSGTILIYLEADIPAELLPTPPATEDTAPIIQDFENTIGLMVRSDNPADNTFASLRATAGFINWKEISYRGPGRCHNDSVPTEGDHQFAVLTIRW